MPLVPERKPSRGEIYNKLHPLKPEMDLRFIKPELKYVKPSKRTRKLIRELVKEMRPALKRLGKK